jgi:hypothetical protein
MLLQAFDNPCLEYNSVNKGQLSMSDKDQEEDRTDSDTLLTLSNIQYLVEGLDALLQTNLDGHKRASVIKLRDELSAYIGSMFSD